MKKQKTQGKTQNRNDNQQQKQTSNKKLQSPKTSVLIQSRPRAPSRRVSHILSESSSTHKEKMPNTLLNLNRKAQAETLELEKLKGVFNLRKI